MSYHSADAWSSYNDPNQPPYTADHRRSSQSLYGLGQQHMAFSDPFLSQPSALSIQTGNLPHASPQDSATTPTPYGQQFTAEPMNRFLTQEAPWTAAHLAPHSLNTAVNQNLRNDPYGPPRSPAQSVTSSFVSGHPRNDSAYCSNASPTNADPVTAGSDCAEVTSMFNDAMRYPLSNASDSPSTPVKPKRAPKSLASNVDEGNIDLPENGKCPECGKAPRLKSELKKHMLRHIRPFRCKMPDCSGANEGFTTSNDLDRHNRSVHSIFPKDAIVYVCAAKNCAEGEKIWPRYDNFKQHCERMHKHEELESLIKRSERPAPPPPADVQAALDKAAAATPSVVSDSAPMTAKGSYDFTPFHPEFYGGIEQFGGGSDISSLVGYPPQFSDDPSTRIAQREAQRHMEQSRQRYRDDASSAYSGRRSNASQSTTSRMPPEVVIHQPENPKQRQHQELAHIFAAEGKPNNFSDSMPDLSRFPPIDNPARHYLTPSTASAGRSRSLSSHSSSSSPRHQRVRSATQPGSAMPRPTTTKRKSETSTGGTTTASKRVRCNFPGCNKAGMRPCELKKHARRHSRPFGCTYDYCYKVFGSKNDWKRHETSQHFQAEMWRCNLPYQPETAGSLTTSMSDLEVVTPCAEPFYDKREMIAHLQERHRLVNDAEVEGICSSQRIGGNITGSYWCGFCREVVPLKNSEQKGWDERFDHIGRHFHPDGRKITEWLPAIGHKTKGELQAQKMGESPENVDEEVEVEEQPEEENEDDVAVVESPSQIVPIPGPLTGSDALGMSDHTVAGVQQQMDPGAVGQFSQMPSRQPSVQPNTRRESRTVVYQHQPRVDYEQVYCSNCGLDAVNPAFPSGQACARCGMPLMAS